MSVWDHKHNSTHRFWAPSHLVVEEHGRYPSFECRTLDFDQLVLDVLDFAAGLDLVGDAIPIRQLAECLIPDQVAVDHLNK